MSALSNFLKWIEARLSPESREWWQAIIAEADSAPDGLSRSLWLCGGFAALLRHSFHTGIRGLTSDHEGNRLPAELLIVAFYQCLFSVVLIGVIAFQIPHARERWFDTIPVLAICLFVVALPAVFGVGLLLLDDASRIASIVLSIAHGLLAWKMMQLKWPEHALVPAVRLLLDVFIIYCLLKKAVRGRFKMARQELHLIQ